jgi:hypothetical protein
MNLRQKGWNEFDWFDLAQDRHRRRALVSIIMNSGLHEMFGNSLVTVKLTTFHEGFSSTVVVRMVKVVTFVSQI